MKHMWSEEEIDGASKVIDSLVDSKGHPRFIEGKVQALPVVEGLHLDLDQCKWSLSGTHLMLVIAGRVDNGTVIPAVDWAHFILPIWIMNKIQPVWNDRIERKNFELVASNYSSQNLTFYLGKQNSYLFITAPTITLTADRNFRVQFDLLISAD